MRNPGFWALDQTDTNKAVQPKKMARGLKIWIRMKRDFTTCVAKTEALIRCGPYPQSWSASLVFAYENVCFPYDGPPSFSLFQFYYYYKLVQYTATFYGCNNEDFQLMLFIFSFLLLTFSYFLQKMKIFSWCFFCLFCSFIFFTQT